MQESNISKWTKEESCNDSRNRMKLENKFQKILFTLSGLGTSVTSALRLLYGDDSTSRIVQLVDDVMDLYQTSLLSDLQKKMIPCLYDYLYLAISICYFFETNDEAKNELSCVSHMHFEDIVNMIQSENFTEYIECRYSSKYSFYDGNLGKNDFDSADYGTLDDLNWYEMNWTDSVYEYKNNENLFKILYIIVSALNKDGNYDYILFSEKNTEKIIQGLDIKSVKLDEEFYDIDKKDNSDLFQELSQKEASEKNSFLISIMEKYISSFPNPTTFLFYYRAFKAQYTKSEIRNNLPNEVSTILNSFLTRYKLSLFHNAEYFNHIYYNLMVTLDCAEEFSAQNIEALFNNAK